MAGALTALDLAGMAPRPPDPAEVAAAVARYQAYQGLREFRARLYGCLTARSWQGIQHGRFPYLCRCVATPA